MEKKLKSRNDLDFGQTVSTELFCYTKICSSFKLIDPLFLSYRVYRQTRKHENTQTYSGEYSIGTVDKQQK